MRETLIFIFIVSIFALSSANERLKKNVGIFNVIKFTNDPCIANDGKNGTCYTKDECEEKSGTSAGTCAEGYGVCCTFIMGCGSKKFENCTYFESTKGLTGMCNAEICKCSEAVCQIRLDFTTFILTGPVSIATDTLNSNQLILNGVMSAAAGVAITERTRCNVDQFAVTSPGSQSSPIICGINTGAHMYIDASDSCNTLSFHIGSVSGTATREWAVKITQYVCDSLNLAPDGCLQYFFGSTSGIVQTFNYEGGMHLANQNQNICIRREKNQCRICYSESGNDFNLSFKSNLAVIGKSSQCCGYGMDGAGTKGYDCVIIPMASKKATLGAVVPSAGDEFCGQKFNTATSATTGATICSQSVPFRIRFLSDNAELKDEVGSLGFRLSYQQYDNCGV